MKEKAMIGKEKRNSKRKSSTSELESEVQTGLSKVVINLSVSKDNIMRMSEVKSVKTLEASLRASVT